MDWKKLGKKLLFPHTAVMIILLPVATLLLVLSLVYLDSASVFAILSYVLSMYTLTVWCIKIPDLIRFIKSFKENNRHVQRWLGDTHLRTNIIMSGSLIWNIAYALMQAGLGYIHSTFWFYSLAGYYLCLAVMRFYLIRYTARHTPGENMKAELKRYRTCGCVFLVLNLMLSFMIFFMVYWNRTFNHHEITTIALAAYTFTTFTAAIVNFVKYRKYNSPVLSAGKAISLTAACVSMITLESTMLTTFGDGSMTLTDRRILLGCTGGAVSVFIIVMSIIIIKQSNKKLQLLETEKE